MRTFSYNEKLLNEKHVLKYVNRTQLTEAVTEAVNFVRENVDPAFEGCAPDCGKGALYRKFVEAVTAYNKAVEAEAAEAAKKEAEVETPAPKKERKARNSAASEARAPQHRLEVYTAELKEKEAIENPDLPTRRRIASLRRKISRAAAALQKDAANAARIARKNENRKNNSKE